MSTRRLQFALLASLGTLAVAGQLSQVSQQVPSAPRDGQVRVYVYRTSGILEKEFRPSVYVDETGTHIFRSSDKKEPVSLDLKQGERYFVRIDVSLVALKGHGKVVLVLPEQGAAEYAQTKPADKKMVKGRTLIAPEFTAK